MSAEAPDADPSPASSEQDGADARRGDPARPQRRDPRLDFGLRGLAALVTGCCMWLGVPDFNLWWLGFVGWIPWLWAIEGQSVKRAFLLGLISGISAIFVGYFWMTELLDRFAGFPMIGSLGVHLLFSAAQGLQWALPAALIVYLRRRTGMGTLLLAPLCWTAIEVSLPNIFPTYLALMWCWQPVWIQTAEIGGVATITFTMVAINAAAYELLMPWVRERKIERKPAIILVAWLVAVPSYGLMRIHQVDALIDESPKLGVGVVQGNFGIMTYANAKNKRRILDEMQRKSAELETQGAELILWGETAYPYSAFRRDQKEDFEGRRGRRLRVRRRFKSPIILGAMTRARDRKADPYPYNTAIVIHSDGTIGDVMYDKNYPLAFGEAAPWPIDPEWYLDQIPSASHLNTGDGPVVLEVAGYRMGPLICYEDILPRFTRETANQGIHAFVNLTNDSWFGKTRAQHEHLGLALFRAVEHRRGLLRSVNAGVSVYVDPAGRLVHETEVTDSDEDGYQGATGFTAFVPMIDPEHRTIYARTGETFGVLIWLGMIGLGVRGRRRREDEDSAARPTE